MLLNLSNHPSQHWPANQIEAARQHYEHIQDMAFPQINPQWSFEQIIELAEQYCTDITKIIPPPKAVHLMGELTFTFALVKKLKAAGIPCIASTTERSVSIEQDGTKTSTFRFIRFREYY